ncbi:protein kinase domain-containing protein [Paraliomyxa miuraensis]|uniref:protein kinase domain-containing protein n=1 Tax=Paraliomyxa miuraensis TaxID=376150 RepID=UPI00224E4465|nr:tetratricopeptide repeat protein [Paraliomyxa miuraensis]MCX4239720.1 tetratricopeptide repeat protein [Paraliomyxa miuraensis]
MPDRELPSLGLPPEDLESRRLRAECARELFGDDAPDLMRLGRFTLVSELGTGGQGAVYVADDPTLDRRVALKRLTATGPKQAEQLRREAQALAKITHPNVVTVYEVGEDETGRPFLVMELVDGQPLQTWLRQAPRSWTEIVDVLVPIAEGLVAIHAAGLVHRDVKPHNIVITHDGKAKLVDLGIAAKDAEPPAAVREPTTAPTPTPGTVGYMAPECFSGRATPQSDQLSFCVTLYEALHGVRPSWRLTRPDGWKHERLDAHAATPASDGRSDTGPDEPPDPKAALARRTPPPKALVRVLGRGLQHDPAQRHADMDALVKALLRVRRRRGTWPLLALAGLVAVGTALVVHGASTDPCDDPRPAQHLWDHDAREAMRAAFVATGSPQAEPTFVAVEHMLDDATLALDRRFADVCATGVEPTARQLALAELHTHHATLRTVMGSLAHVDAPALPEVPIRLAPLLDRMHDPGPRDACEATDAALAPTAELEAIEASMQEAVARGIAGDYDAALAGAESALSLAQGEALAPLRARLHLQRGRLALDAQRLDEAVRELDTARSQAETLGCDGLGSEALSLWAKARILDSTGALDEATQAVRVALEKLDRLGIDGSRRAEALNSQGLVLHRKHDDEAAVASYREALAIREALDPPAMLDMALTTLNLGAALSDLGQTRAAIATLERARTLLESALWPDHPSLYKAHANLSHAYLAAGDLPAAQRSLERALVLAEAGFGPDSPKLANLHVAMARVLDYQHEFEAAIDHATQADAIMVRAGGPDDARRVVTLEAIGQALTDAGQPGQAVPPFEQALALQAKSGQASAVDLAIGRGKLAQAHAGAGQHDRARLLFEEAQRPFDVDPSLREDSYYPELLLGWGETLVALGRRDDAVVPLREAIARWSERDDNPERLAHARWALARASCATDREHALAEARTALDHFTAGEVEGASRMREEISSWIDRGCASG